MTEMMKHSKCGRVKLLGPCTDLQYTTGTVPHHDSPAREDG